MMIIRKTKTLNHLGEIFSRTSAQFAGKFVEFAVLAGGDSLRKFENFIKGAEYKRILKERIHEVEVEEEPTETEPAVSIKALPLNSRTLKKKFCHFFNNGPARKGIFANSGMRIVRDVNW